MCLQKVALQVEWRLLDPRRRGVARAQRGSPRGHSVWPVASGSMKGPHGRRYEEGQRQEEERRDGLENLG